MPRRSHWSEERFQRAVERITLHEQSRTLARMVLVEGRTQMDVCREMNRSRKWLTDILDRVRRADRESVPPDWQEYSVKLPPGWEAELRALERRAHQDWIYRQTKGATDARTEEEPTSTGGPDRHHSGNRRD